MEEYKKILIITEYDNQMDKVIDFIDWSLKSFTSEKIMINDGVMLIDTYHTVEELEAEFEGFDIKIVDITDINLYGIVDESLKQPILEAKKTLDISDNVNYFLDLIAEKGDICLLNDKERQRLYKLSKKN
jgi:hypothetical protein